MTARLLVCAVCVGAPLSSQAEERSNSLHDDAWALQFSFDSGFSGGRIAAKYHLSDKNALRAGLSFFESTQDVEGNTSGGVTSEGDNDFARTDAEVLYMRYPRPLGGAHFYFGGGPYVEYWERNDHQLDTEPTIGQEERIREDQTVEAGLMVTLGAEWFVSKSLSLHMEYIMSGGHFWRDYEESYVSTSTLEYRTYETTTEGWELEAGGHVFIGLGIYL